MLGYEADDIGSDSGASWMETIVGVFGDMKC